MKDYVITGQKSSLFSETEYDSLLLGHLDLLGTVAPHGAGVLVFKFKGWPKHRLPRMPTRQISFFLVSIGIFSLKNLEAVSGWCQEQQLFL